MTLLVIGLAIFLLLLRTPLYIVVLTLGLYFFTITDIPLISAIISFQKLESQSFLSAIPLFTFAGYLLSQSQASRRFITLSSALFSFLPGSTSLVVVLVMALFTSLTGASGVSILALGGLMYPLLYNATRNEKFSHGIITASGSIGLLFAPALPVIIYAIISNQNSTSSNLDIEKLFYAALVPSFLLIGFFTIYSTLKERQLANKTSFNKNHTKTNLKVVTSKKTPIINAIAEAKYEIPLPFLVYGGIYLGFISVLEASILTALYTFFLVFIIRKDLSLKKDFVTVTVQSLKLSGGIFIIMVSAFILTNYLVYERIPDALFEFLSQFIKNKFSFLLLVNVFLLITGCLLDIFSAILIVLPLLVPLVERYGINPYHFAIIFLVNLEIGYLTPPVGLNLFIASYRFKKNIVYLYRSIVPFLLIMGATLLLITYVPWLSTFTLPTNNAKVTDTIAPKELNAEILNSSETNISLRFLPCEDNLGEPCDKYSVLYIDEHINEIDMLLDLGFSEVAYLSNSSENPNAAIKEESGYIILDVYNLYPNSNYTLAITAFDTSGNESIPSPLLLTTTK